MGNRFPTSRDKFRAELKTCVEKLAAKHKIPLREAADLLEGRAEMMKDEGRAGERAKREAARAATLAAEQALEAAKARPALPPGQRNGKRG